MDQNEVEYVCPFCAAQIKGAVPPSCKMCGNSFRDLDLSQVQDGETLIEGLEKVTEFTRKQQEGIKNRKNWYKEDLQKKHPTSNVKWDNLFQTNYQRVNSLSVDDSLKEIEEFTKIADGNPHDESEWKGFLNKYKGFNKTSGAATNLPVSDAFLSQLQHDRNKKDKDVPDHEKAAYGNTEVSQARYGANVGHGRVTRTETTTANSQDTVVIPVVFPKERLKINASEREKFNLKTNKGKGEAAFAKYLNDQNNKTKKLW
uniref:Uncharacterized protein n=1 Tax=Aplanochytrium stocchinoi TaxID=215587 RepID=A0A7S3LMZ9_9STRA|mmetsp:Transcript_17414/g.22180  ORF Transcript_17414/g.22180 Transcript_17414/m.22180 type:complete len:258 (+) Transcript_17414:126-899(+)